LTVIFIYWWINPCWVIISISLVSDPVVEVADCFWFLNYFHPGPEQAAVLALVKVFG
jgi:hypothetical protein